MQTYSIQQVSNLLQISKDTLRYYDKFDLVCPKRSENRYRYYTEQDILDLRYAEVMKFSGFTLVEIRKVFQFKRAHNVNNFPEILRILDDKKMELIRKQKLFYF
ncbi:MerR family transcriptional regulator [Dehalobacter sp. TBBPA1]|uniref:MerR family transcriptional regulator n=1 Tax=Dehalobacter sp. TBBPA1 TaxID=3235037 RepID=UPI0034A0F404